MSRPASLCIAMLCGLASSAAAEPVHYPATLAGHAVLPAQSFTLPPVDAPPGLFLAGRFSGNERTERPYALVDDDTGLGRPFPGQPLQGFSGIRRLVDGRFLLLSDNGFGSRTNSADAMLMFHIGVPDWETGRVVIEETRFLRDPDRRISYPLVNEHTAERYLTGADLDPESIQPVGDGYWIGDEFGPYLLRIDASGRVTDFVETTAGGDLVQSPDHHRLALPANPGDTLPPFNLRRSRGYEGMALADDGTTLLPLLEGQVWDAETGAFEMVGGRAVLRLMAFDTTGGGWSDEIRFYPLERPDHAIGDFNMLDERRGLVIERDGLQGDAREGVAEPAAFKRVYLIDIVDTDANGVISKLGYIDLLAIADPDGTARRGSRDGVFSFPFVTIENVDRVDERHVIVANDNNYPFSTGRAPDSADDNEFILLEVSAFLAAE